MISPIKSNDISDARLVAYIDGELSLDDRAAIALALAANPQLRERLAFLNTGARAFGEAFDLLLAAAPEARLQAMFASLVDGESAKGTAPLAESADNVVRLQPAPKRGLSPIWQLAAAASIALTAYGGGIVTAVLYGPKEVRQQVAQRGWMDAVAQYVSLFSQETLAGMPADAATQQAGLQRVSTALGKDISHDKVEGLPTLAFRGTQLLQLEGRPIAQIAFLSDAGKPVAICIIKTARPAEPQTTARREGLNIVHWITGGYGYMVIGDMPADTLARISEAARARLS
jgi:anti-sigma factor RsiW